MTIIYWLIIGIIVGTIFNIYIKEFSVKGGRMGIFLLSNIGAYSSGGLVNIIDGVHPLQLDLTSIILAAEGAALLVILSTILINSYKN